MEGSGKEMMDELREFKVKLTVTANGMPSGTAQHTIQQFALEYVYLPPSINVPFQSAAAPFALIFKDVTYLEESQLAFGFVQLADPNMYPLTDMTPFMFYVGAEWPQSIVGMLHFHKMYEMVDDKKCQFSLLIERDLES